MPLPSVVRWQVSRPQLPPSAAGALLSLKQRHVDESHSSAVCDQVDESDAPSTSTEEFFRATAVAPART
jgi:hypothetical protein